MVVMKLQCGTVFWLCVCFVLFPHCTAEWYEVNKVVGVAESHAGTSVAIHNDKAAVGVPFAGQGTGLVEFLQKEGKRWVPIPMVLSFWPDYELSEGTYFGHAVSLNSKMLAVSSVKVRQDRGALYLFKLDNNGMSAEQVAYLIDPDSGYGSHFGDTVVLKEDTVLVSAPSAVEWGKRTYGRVSCWYKSQASKVAERWASCGQLNIRDGTLKDNAYLGSGLAMEGDTAAVGARGVDKVYVFKRQPGNSGQEWRHTQTMGPGAYADEDEHIEFGSSVSLSEGLLAVGAQRHAKGKTGVFIFREMEDGRWHQVKALRVRDPTPADFFGLSVALSGNILAVGAPLMNTHVNHAGMVMIYEIHPTHNTTAIPVSPIVYTSQRPYHLAWSNGNSVHVAELAAFSYDNAYFGMAVDVSYSLKDQKPTLIVGAPGENQEQGAAYMFHECNSPCLNGGEVDPIDCKCACKRELLWRGEFCGVCNPNCGDGMVSRVSDDGKCECVQKTISGKKAIVDDDTYKLIRTDDLSNPSACNAALPCINGTFDQALCKCNCPVGSEGPHCQAGTPGGCKVKKCSHGHFHHHNCSCSCHHNYHGSHCQHLRPCHPKCPPPAQCPESPCEHGQLDSACKCTCHDNYHGDGCKAPRPCHPTCGPPDDGAELKVVSRTHNDNKDPKCPESPCEHGQLDSECKCTCHDNYHGEGCKAPRPCHPTCGPPDDGAKLKVVSRTHNDNKDSNKKEIPEMETTPELLEPRERSPMR